MKLKKNILLTFDYELFLGPNSGTAKNCLLTPTSKLLAVLQQTKAKAIFFVDVLYLYRLKELIDHNPQAKIDYEAVCDQIAEMAKQGHYVYLHVHPHWLDAIYNAETNQWNLHNTARFAMSNLNEKDGYALLENAYLLLKELISNISHAHKIEGYRAGGLFIQPFNIFYRFLKNYQMPYEFSVYPKFTSKSAVCEVDFTHIPQDRIYKFEEDCCVEQKKGYFTEFTISEINISGINRIVNSAQFRLNTRVLNDKSWGDGKGALHIISNNNKRIGINGIVRETAAVELMNLWKNKIYMSYLQKHNLFHFLSHPKLISPLNLLALHKFLVKANQKYNVITDFKHF